MNTLLAATPGLTAGRFLGAITLSGLALGAGIALILGVRGSDRIKINTRDKTGWFAIFTSTLFLAAGGTWTSIATGVGSVPTSVLGPGSGLGDPGMGGVALAVTLVTFGPRWKKLIWPALFGLACAYAYSQAGGVWGMPGNIILMAIGRLTGAA